MRESNGNSMENIFMKSLKLFVNEVEKHDNLEIVAEVQRGGCNGSDIIVIENSDVENDKVGHQITVEVPEIFAKCGDAKQAERFVGVVNSTENPIVLHGVTRIVGYYSRVQNWNKSKVGELRDRQKGQYGTGKHVREHGNKALAVVDAL